MKTLIILLVTTLLLIVGQALSDSGTGSTNVLDVEARDAIADRNNDVQAGEVKDETVDGNDAVVSTHHHASLRAPRLDQVSDDHEIAGTTRWTRRSHLFYF